MPPLRVLASRLLALFSRRRLDQRLDEEVQCHLEMVAAEKIRQGMTPEDASSAARREFGGVEQIKETYRDARGIPFVESLIQDLRYAARVLRKSPGFTTVAVLTLALGIGANTAIFSVVNSVVLKPLPYAAPERLARLYSEFPGFPGGGLHKFWISPPEFLDLRRETTSWESLDAWTGATANLAGGAEPVRVTECILSGGLLPTLGVQPALGRFLTPQDDTKAANPATVIAHGLWLRAFGGDPRIVGRDVRVNGQPFTVVGVMPPEFQFPPGEIDAPDVWIPLRLDPARPGDRSHHGLSLIGRLKNGISLGRAREELNRLVSRWAAAAPPRTHAFHPKDHPVLAFPFHDEVVGAVRPAMLTMLAAVGFVLLIACVNVANLLLARAEARQREIAVRVAIGAGARRLLRQFLVEGLLLSLSGAVCGLGLAFGGLRLILAASRNSIPRAAEIGVDLRVLGFTLGIALLASVFFGLAPLVHLLSANVHDSLKAAGSRLTASVPAHRVRQAMVAAQLALALVLLIGTGLMLRAFWKLQAVQVGFQPSRLLTAQIRLPGSVYPPNSRISLLSRLQQRLATLPGVVSATIVGGLPPLRPVDANDTEIEGFVPRPGGPIQNVDYYQVAGERYFETMGIALIEGRFFDPRDGEGAPATVIVNQTMARTFWPGQSAIGRRINPDKWRTIVGVVGDVKNAGLDKPAGTELYLPYRQAGDSLGGACVVVRAARDPLSLVPALRAQVAALDSSLPIASVQTMEDVLLAAQSRPRFLTLLLTLFSTVALALAAVGIYGVMSYSVAQRTSEFGIRVAMGAQRTQILGMVIGQGLRLGLIGSLAGAVGAFALTRFLRGLLFGIDPLDAATFLATALPFLAVILAACYLPALRATRVDPNSALRQE